MRNRAKCKSCGIVIESTTPHDVVKCQCGKISISGGLEKFIANALDFNEFLRIDDDGKVIAVTYVEKQAEKEDSRTALTKADCIAWIDDMINRMESLPEHAMSQPMSQYDYYSLVLLLKGFLQ